MPQVCRSCKKEVINTAAYCKKCDKNFHTNSTCYFHKVYNDKNELVWCTEKPNKINLKDKTDDKRLTGSTVEHLDTSFSQFDLIMYFLVWKNWEELHEIKWVCYENGCFIKQGVWNLGDKCVFKVLNSGALKRMGKGWYTLAENWNIALCGLIGHIWITWFRCSMSMIFKSTCTPVSKILMVIYH